MVKWIKHYLWFWKESFSFMKGSPLKEIILGCIRMAPSHATSMCRWEKLTPEQRENWYLSGEGRVWEW